MANTDLYWLLPVVYLHSVFTSERLCVLFFVQLVNSSPGAAYMRQWIWSALVQIMTCRLFGAKPLPKPMLCYCQLDPWKQTSLKFESNYKTLNSVKKALENVVCEIAAILSRGIWVKQGSPWRYPRRCFIHSALVLIDAVRVAPLQCVQCRVFQPAALNPYQLHGRQGASYPNT